MFGSLGITELVLILIIVLIIFGAGKLPQLGEGVGKAIKGFKKSVHEADVIEAEAQAASQPPQAAQASGPETGQATASQNATTSQIAEASPTVPQAQPVSTPEAQPASPSRV
ncbi:MAG: twin-arginine translocase TatA/TatE family subunit [Nitrospirota bacterium]|nr:twin-arginine translocase TatA/TatE family subunit [Nitrospirota bacterium]